MIISAQRGAHCSRSATERQKAATLMNLTFFSPPISFVQLSYLIYCSLCLCVAFLSFYFPLFNPIHYPGPLCPSTIRAHKALHSVWMGLSSHSVLFSPGMRNPQRIPGAGFFFLCAGGTQTPRRESRWGAQLKDKCFWEALTPKAKLLLGPLVLPYTWSVLVGLWNGRKSYTILH